MSVRITCISKSAGYHENPHEAISSFGWTNEQTQAQGRSDREAMWKWLNEGGVAYVKDTYGNTAYAKPRTNTRGTRYVQTVADNIPTDNLLKLPECY